MFPRFQKYIHVLKSRESKCSLVRNCLQGLNIRSRWFKNLAMGKTVYLFLKCSQFRKNLEFKNTHFMI
jgi:hypothetical protein